MKPNITSNTSTNNNKIQKDKIIRDQSVNQLKTVSNQNIYNATTYIEEIEDNKKDLQRLCDRMY